MNSLAEAISTEREHPQDPASAYLYEPPKKSFTSPTKEKIARFNEIIDTAMTNHPRACVAFSGGSDSLVLLDLIHRGLDSSSPPPIVIWTDTQMEYPGSREFVEKTVAKYNLELRIARAPHTPREQWARTGWPILGKMAARLWMQQNRHMGFKINVSECCRAMKIKPARTLARNLGLELQITGQRGSQDDGLRGLRTLKDGNIFYQQRDRLWIVNPLTDWTDAEIQGYIKQHKLEEHPARTRGALTIGCVYCGGGSQYTNSGYRILRKTWPEAWRRLIVEWGAGLVILALKHKRPIDEIRAAVQELGGLQTLAKFQPWLFDFTRKTPQPGYTR